MITNFLTGFLVPAASLVGLCFIENDQKELAIALLIVSVGFNSAIFCGFQVNHIDLAPNHASTLMGITNGLSNIASILAPLAVQVIIPLEEEVQTIYILHYKLNFHIK